MKYIDADNLRAKIVSICLFPQLSADYNDGREDMKMMVLNIIDSLQQEQPDVDLEKELDNYWGMYRKDGKTYDIQEGEECVDCKELVDPYNTIAFARHFYERGKLNARKEE